jgi:nucleotide-binding universal stress UspA family protein
MQKLFNNILVPVNFSRISEKAIEKAIDLANDYNCNIYLFHVISSSAFLNIGDHEGIISPTSKSTLDGKEIDALLQRLKTKYEKSLKGKGSIYANSVRGQWNESLIEFINDRQIDVVLIGQQGHLFQKKRSLLNVNRIAEKTNIPVITVPENRRLTKLYSIIIPITDFLPVKKLLYGVYLAQHCEGTIKLLGIESDKDYYHNKKVQYYLKKSFQLIRDNCSVPLEIVTTSGENVADAVNQYATKFAADLVIVNPGKQSRMPGVLSSILGNFLQKFSGPPVLTINTV